MTEQLASPYSTGGGGADFETRVLAHSPRCALIESSARGLPADAVTREVRSQTLHRGFPLDDILVITGGGKLALQVKRDLVFVDVLRRAWQTFQSDQFDRGVD